MEPILFQVFGNYNIRDFWKIVKMARIEEGEDFIEYYFLLLKYITYQ